MIGKKLDIKLIDASKCPKVSVPLQVRLQLVKHIRSNGQTETLHVRLVNSQGKAVYRLLRGPHYLQALKDCGVKTVVCYIYEPKEKIGDKPRLFHAPPHTEYADPLQRKIQKWAEKGATIKPSDVLVDTILAETEPVVEPVGG